MTKLKIRGAVPPLPHSSSWRSAEGQTNFYLPL